MTLHITNGSSVQLGEARMEGEYLYWNDVLHEGPAPAGLTLEEMSRVRAEFLESCGWARPDFTPRDRTLAGFQRFEEVVLWFEHDLYDQLQLIQLLDWFAGRERGTVRLSLVCTNRYLGCLKPCELAALYPARRDITAEQLARGRAAWQAFCAPDPAGLERLAAHETPALPYLSAALSRFLEQYPALENGLSRTERQILEVVAAGAGRFADVFTAEQRKEEHIFMGDDTLWLYLHAMAKAPVPLLTVSGQSVAITAAGRHVLAGSADHVRLNGIDRWLGGVHLRGAEARWRWDRVKRRLV